MEIKKQMYEIMTFICIDLTIMYDFFFRYLGDCYNPVEEAKRLTRNSSHHETEITVLEDDIYYHTCVAKSLSAKASGIN